MTIYVFDVDDTLVESEDHHFDQYAYAIFDPENSLPTYELFRQNKGKKEIHLLTARHPAAQMQLAKFFGIAYTQIHHRDFALDYDECYRLQSRQNLTDVFLKETILFKTRWLMQFCYTHPAETIIYYDDQYRWFQITDLPTNLSIEAPIRDPNYIHIDFRPGRVV